MSPDPIRPALTPEEWEQLRELRDPEHPREWIDEARWCQYAEVGDDAGHLYVEVATDPLGVAAASLHGHPQGFTHEDVRRHRASAEHLRRSLEEQGPKGTWDFPQEEIESKWRHVRWHESMADRIAALLPPEQSP